MLFNSFEFLFFFLVVAAAFHALSERARPVFLLAASYVFYMAWNPFFGMLLFGITLVSYLTGRAIAARPALARFSLWTGVASHVGVLFLFKYYAFFAENASRLVGWAGADWRAPELEILLPVGISFYTFQSISYMADVYRRQIPAERSLPAFMLYVSFFPQLLAGPIQRAGELLPQLKGRPPSEGRRVGGGLALIGAGLFKKVVIADTLSIVVASIFLGPAPQGGLALFLGALAARYMIYCDIAGYTDIALGCARTLGVNLAGNFARPFAARNIAEYWQRWHISLSSWFRDYVFFSLAAGPLSRLGVPGLVLITFFLLGLWHGASWNFVLWGIVNGLLMVAYQAMKSRNALPAAPAGVKVAFTFLFLVGLPTVFVATRDLSHAAAAFGRIFDVSAAGWWDVGGLFRGEHAGRIRWMVLMIAGLEAAQLLDERRPIGERLRSAPAPVRWLVWAGGLALLIVTLGLMYTRHRSVEFVYFQF